jgi:transaldolase
MTMANNPLIQIEKEYNQSIWMDNLTRNLIQSGELKEMITTRGIVGITSNPAIFQKAISGNVIYDADIEAGIKAGKSVQDIYESLVFDDIRNACDIFSGIYQQSNGLDGYVSIEVPPDLAHNAEQTVAEAKRYYSEIGRDNVMIKIPGTPEGLTAVEKVIEAGINVNVTLLFSVQSYIDTAWAFIRGLEARAAKGEDISNIASVASFFISRIDINVDARLDKLIAAAEDDAKKEELRAMKGKFAIANAKIAYQKYKEIIQTERWKVLSAKGAKMQRLLWASTGTKDPNYSDVLYVDELIGPNTVNTLPPATIEACADHCDVASRIETNVEEAYKLSEELPKLKINLDEVMDELLVDGIDKFVQPFESLIKSLQEKVDKLMPV